MPRHHYDLLSRSGWAADAVLVVAPYVEQSFFARLIKDLAPAELFVLIDDGCRPSEIQMLSALRSRSTVVHVALAGVRGLMHAKIVHVAWTTTGSHRAHSLVYGSGNATGAAFSGGINAELFCKVRLTSANHRDLIAWTGTVKDAILGAGEGRIETIEEHPNVNLATGISLRLPSMRVRPTGAPIGSFDQWLQRGYIVADYRPTPDFLRVAVDLKERLPPGNLERRVIDLGFGTTPTKRLSLPYVEAATGGAGGERWKGRYFVWTRYGLWCSASCRQERRHLFVKAGRKGRLDTLGRLRELSNPNAAERARTEHLDRLEQLWSTLGGGAGRYLESSRRRLDRDHYGRRFDDRLRYDLELASDEVFEERYLTGCEINVVPRFRDDPMAWDGFVESLAEQLHIEDRKRQSMSAVYKRVGSALSGVAGDPLRRSCEPRAGASEKLEQRGRERGWLDDVAGRVRGRISPASEWAWPEQRGRVSGPCEADADQFLL